MAARRGIALVWAVMALLVMVGIVGLSIDWGKLTWNVHQMQNAADAAALAGAQVVKYDQPLARDMAVQFASANVADQRNVAIDRNEGNDPNGELVIGKWSRRTHTFAATTLSPNAVKVIVKRPGKVDDAALPLLFGRIFGTNEAQASRPAVGLSIASLGAGILCISGHPEDYNNWSSEGTSGLVRDSCVIDLRGPGGTVGDIHVNSVGNDSFRLNGRSGLIHAGQISVCGNTTPLPENAAWDAVQGNPDEPFDVNPDMPRIEDPLLALNDTPPDIATMTEYACPDLGVDETATISPGWYPNGIDPGHGEITMQPGVYAVGGGTKTQFNQLTGFTNQNGTIRGNGVMIYVTDGPSASYGKIDIGANAVTDLISRGDAATPKQADGEMGVVLWQDFNNQNLGSISGGAGSKMIGTIYMPDAPLLLGGGPDEMGTQFLVGALHIHGNVTLGVAYDGRNMVRAKRSVLVE